MPSRGPKNETPDFGNSDFVVVANRLPVDAERQPDGSVTWKRSPGGLVTALEPLLRKQRGAWLGWPGIVDSPDAPVEPIVEEGLQLFPVPIDGNRRRRVLRGFLQRHPVALYHDVMVKPIYHREWWDRYVEVNRRFAEETSRAAAEGATVWVQGLSAAAGAQDAADAAAGPHDRVLPPHSVSPVELFMQLRGAPRSSKDSSARTWWDFTCRAAQRTSSICPDGWWVRPPRARRWVSAPGWAKFKSASARSKWAPSRSPSIPPNSISSAAIATSGGEQRKSGSNSAIPARSFSASTGSTTPRASACG